MTMRTKREAKKNAKQKSFVRVQGELGTAAPEVDASGQAPDATATAGEIPASTTPPAGEQALAASADSPLEYMLRVMRDPAVKPARRDAMARFVLPYLHRKQSAMDYDGGSEPPAEVSDATEYDIMRRIGFLMVGGKGESER